MTFLQAVIHYLRTRGKAGKLVTVTEIASSPEVTRFWFWKTRLALIARTGILVRGVWPNKDGGSEDAYGLIPQINTCALAGHSFLPRPAGDGQFLGAEDCEFCDYDSVLSPVLEGKEDLKDEDRHHLFAVTDPHWGKPKVISSTIRESADAAWKAACLNPELSLYSDYNRFPLPDGTPGKPEALKKAGFRIMRVRVTIDGPAEE